MAESLLAEARPAPPAFVPPVRVPTPTSFAIRAAGLTKRFPVRRGWKATLRAPFARPETTVVQDVAFDVAEGEFFALLGPNGAGKTTLFRMLTAATTPDAGSAEICGHDVVRSADAVRSLVGIVLANDRTLYWRISARENLRVYAALYGLRGDRARQRIDEVLRVVDLAHTGEQMVATFSSGMRQRLLIARALLPRPRVLLLDEPTRSLDPISARDFRAFLREDVARNGECTVLIATHSSEEALELCQRAAVLHRGRLRATGTPDELRERFGGHRYALWTTEPGHAALQSLVALGRVGAVEVEPGQGDGWTCVTLSIRGEMDSAAWVLDQLVSSGMRVGRFERANLSLADLLDRVLAATHEA